MPSFQGASHAHIYLRQGFFRHERAPRLELFTYYAAPRFFTRESAAATHIKILIFIDDDAALRAILGKVRDGAPPGGTLPLPLSHF